MRHASTRRCATPPPGDAPRLHLQLGSHGVALRYSPPPSQAASAEEREHAEMLMEYQNKRGGRVRLGSILMPEVEFNHADKVSMGAPARWGWVGGWVGGQGGGA